MQELAAFRGRLVWPASSDLDRALGEETPNTCLSHHPAPAGDDLGSAGEGLGCPTGLAGLLDHPVAVMPFHHRLDALDQCAARPGR